MNREEADADDLAAMQEAEAELENGQTIPWEQVKAELEQDDA